MASRDDLIGKTVINLSKVKV